MSPAARVTSARETKGFKRFGQSHEAGLFVRM